MLYFHFVVFRRPSYRRFYYPSYSSYYSGYGGGSRDFGGMLL